MQPDNPYSAPQVELVDTAGVRALPGWSARQLRVLGWLAVVSALGNALVLLLLFASAWMEEARGQHLASYTEWLNLLLVVLGCYLLIRLKAFAEQRFAASRLAWPIWSMVVFSLTLGAMDFLLGEQLFAGLDGQTIVYLGLLVLLGCSTAWLDIAGGLMLASVLLMLLALLPLLGAGLALALVFFRAAGELQKP